MSRKPTSDRHPWDCALGYREPKLTDAQRAEIREKYVEARQENPKLSKLVFARETAPQYNISGGTVRALLNGL